MTTVNSYEASRDRLYRQINRNNSIVFNWDRFVYSPKRKSTTKNFLVSVFAIVVSLFVSLFIAMAIYGDGTLFYRIIEQIFVSPFNATNWKTTVSMITIFAVSALSFIFAERVGLFNLGISGQMLFGAQLATLMSWYIPSVPNVAGQLLVIIVSMFGAAVISTLVGVLKVFLNINEVISSIMFNWIVYYCGSYMLNSVGQSKGMIAMGGSKTISIGTNFQLAIQGSGTVAGSWLPLLIIMIMLVGISITVLSFSVFGKKISSVGKSSTASLYAGINVKKKQILTMLISGLMAGMLGAMVYCGLETTMDVTVSAKTIPQYGFNGISVGLIAMTNPLGVVPVSLLFGMIDVSKSSITTLCGVDANIAQLMFGIIVYGAAIISAFYYFTPWIWLKQLFYGKNAKKAYHEYNEEIRKHLSNCNNTIASVIQLRKVKRNVFRLRWYSSKEIKKIKKTITKNPYYLENKKKFKTYAAFAKHCHDYEKEYRAIFAGFADMYGRIPVYLKPKFHEAINEKVYKVFGFEWKMLDKHARTEHCLTCQNAYLNEIFNSPSVKGNFKLFDIDPNRLNNKAHIKRIKARVWRYYAIHKKIASNTFNAIILRNRKESYIYHKCKFLYVKNEESKTIKEIDKAFVKVFIKDAWKFARQNTTISLFTLKFLISDYYRSKYLTSQLSANIRTNVNGLVRLRSVMHLVTERLSFEVINDENYRKSKVITKEMVDTKGRPYLAIYLVNPQLAIAKCNTNKPDILLKDVRKVNKMKRKAYAKIKKIIIVKQAYALIKRIQKCKEELLKRQSDLVHLYSPRVLADLSSMQLDAPKGRKGAK